MTSKYRVECRCLEDPSEGSIEWIKGLLAVPFVLHSQPAAAYDKQEDMVTKMAPNARRRYAEIMRDVEELVNDHIAHQKNDTHSRSKLKFLVPAVGRFYTPLALEEAFLYQDDKRKISSRRFVPPSFNDIRLTLNTAQLLSLSRGSPLKLITFDGDVTLYDDGHSLTPDNPVISRILRLLSQGIKVGIVTAAGYTDSIRYYERLHGLLEAIKAAFGNSATSTDRPSLVILGGESQYLYALDFNSVNLLKCVPRVDWMLPQMKSWSDMDINALLDVAEGALQECVTTLGLSATIIRKERAVGIIPTSDSPDHRFSREQLEETVLVTQQKVEMLAPSVPFCAFNGGNDVFVDIGDKSWGVLACQNYFGKITGAETLHVGDQFLSAGANDFKARLVCTTAWIANPTETVQLLDEMQFHSSVRAKKEEVKEEDDTEDFEEERL